MKKLHIIYAAMAIIFLLFISRLVYLQLITDRYLLNGVNTSIKAEVVIPQRGYVFDRKGKLLVGNSPSYELTVNSWLLKNNFDTIGFCRLIGIDKARFKELLIEVKAQKNYSPLIPMKFISNLNNEDYGRIQEKLYKYKAFELKRRPIRSYLIATAGNVLGYTGEVNKLYIQKDSTYYESGDLAGISGVEKSYERELRGVKGKRYIQQDRQGRKIGSHNDGENDVRVQSGKDITLTIDYGLQELAEKLLTHKHGGIIAIDPKTGEILCMASAPLIDPNLFTGPDKQKNILALNLDSVNKPIYDRGVQAQYPPGSPFKLLTGLAAMQMGVIDTATRFVCHHGFRYGKRKIACHCGTGYPIEIEMAIAKSCNNYFSSTYKKILEKYPSNIDKSIDEWKSIMTSFNMGVFINSDLSIGNKGNIPTAAYYNKWYGKGGWNPYGVISNGIGQGEITATPIQMASFTAAIANQGYFYTPHIVKLIDGKPIKNPIFTKKHFVKIAPQYFPPVIRGMQKCIDFGTGKKIKTKLFTQAGKTGTAQNPHGQDHSLFVLFAPVENPKIAVAVIVENGHFGATWGAPMASLIAEKYLTDSVTRKPMMTRMIKGNLESQYKRQWVNHLRSIGKYEEPLKLKTDTIERKTITQGH